MSVPRVAPRSRAVVLLWHKLGDCKGCPTIKLKRGRKESEEGEEGEEGEKGQAGKEEYEGL